MTCPRPLIAFIIGALSYAHAASGQLLRGRVVEAATSVAVKGATIRVLGLDSLPVAIGVADDSGQFTIEIPRGGAYRLEFSRIGYALRLSKPMQLDTGQAYEVNNVQLAPRAVAIAPLPVRGEARVPALERNGFYTRKQAGLGHFIDRARIEKRAPVATTDMFSEVRGVRLSPKTGGGSNVFLRAGAANNIRTGGWCSPLVFVDGVPMSFDAGLPAPANRGIRESTPPYDFDLMHPQDIEAIEIYRTPSEVPSRYSGAGSSCGVILIWRRTGR
jgi:Carboxypeptidase regulatory-like domain/TonB-dependent Receptor Plug Domain